MCIIFLYTKQDNTIPQPFTFEQECSKEHMDRLLSQASTLKCDGDNKEVIPVLACSCVHHNAPNMKAEELETE